MNLLLVALALAASLGGSGPGGPGGLETLLPGDPLEGSRLFADKGCPTCHAIRGVGGTTGPDLGRAGLGRPLLEIAGVMWNHSPGMEEALRERHLVRPNLTSAELSSLIAFLYYVGSLDAPGDPESGARLVKQRQCLRCHSLRGEGQTIAAPLDPYGRFASPLFITAELWNHGRQMADRMHHEGVVRLPFEGNDLPDLVAYLRSQAGGIERQYIRPGNPRQGSQLFTAKGCVRCHSVHGEGGNVGPDLGVALSGSLMQIVGALWNHGPRMWAKMMAAGHAPPTFSAEEMSDLVTYLYFFQFMDAPADATRGAKIFQEKHCGTCHESTVQSQRKVPRIGDSVRTLGSSLDVIAAMWNHAGQMQELLTEANVEWPLFKGSEMADLVAYLLTLRPAALPDGGKN